jgi:hypothetical protein
VAIAITLTPGYEFQPDAAEPQRRPSDCFSLRSVAVPTQWQRPFDASDITVEPATRFGESLLKEHAVLRQDRADGAGRQSEGVDLALPVDVVPRIERGGATQSAARCRMARASFKASRLLNTATATLAAGVLTDSATEHYRAGFHHRAMFIAPIVSAAAMMTAMAPSWPPAHRVLPRVVFATSVVAGVLGCGFHLTNVSRRVGGWSSTNVFYGAPIAAPLAITMAGLLGLAASRLARSVDSRGDQLPRRPGSRVARALGGVSAVALAGTSIEAGALHLRGAFQNPFMYAPVIIPPIAATALATATLIQSPEARRAAGVLLRLTTWLGIAGTGFHAWGVHRRMGGWTNWRQNVLAGPPLPAPPAFTGLALAGLAALELLDAERI